MKKECGFFRDRLFDFSIGEIEPDIAEKIKEHIELCPDCWKIVDDYKRTDSTVAGILKVDFSEDIWQMERKEIIKRATQKIDIKKEVLKILKMLFTTKRVLTAAVATVLLVFCVMVGGIQYKKSQELNKQKIVIQNIGLFENIELLERLDFYKKINDKGIDL